MAFTQERMAREVRVHQGVHQGVHRARAEEAPHTQAAPPAAAPGATDTQQYHALATSLVTVGA